MRQYDKIMQEMTLDKMVEFLEDPERRCEFCKYTIRDVECVIDGGNCREGIKTFLESEVNENESEANEND